MQLIYLSLALFVLSCSNNQGQNKQNKTMEKKVNPKHSNQLINETSPYLLQHAHNPVDWYAWGNEAFKKAKAEDKLVLISIGYAACHWCHVMEHESFENKAVAKIMNDNFICIKVDREERPDVDQIYMSAVQLITGSGGWPLNCFALPDGRPVYGGTYFKTDQWLQILEGLALSYKKDKDRVLKSAKDISEGIKNHELISYKKPELKFSDKQVLKMIVPWKKYFDTTWGGNKRTPKFPLPSSYEFLLQYAFHSNDKEALNHLNVTLQKIGDGGIYDHVGGGFARYAVDEKWMVPHFEKMLYDNGQLISLYSNAYKLTKNETYKQKVLQTLGFIRREMTSQEGVFYSSYDADSEGVEGKFYVWSKNELEKLLGQEAKWFCDYFNVTEKGNWEESNILWVTDKETVLKKYNLSQEELNKKLNKIIPQLLKERSTRIYPGLDDKILTSWNGLMAIGYLDAYEAFGDKDYLESALQNGAFIKNTMLQKNGSLHRNYMNGHSNITAFLDDYAITIQLFTKLYQNTFNEEWLKKAQDLTEYTLEHFHDTRSGMFYYTSDVGEQLIARKMELTDNVMPGSNSIMANNLFDLGTLLSNEEWVKMASQMLSNVSPDMEINAPYYANWGILLNKFAYSFYELVFTGKQANKLSQVFSQQYHPNTIIAGHKKESENNIPLLEGRFVDGESYIYICQNKACKLPVKTLSQAFELIRHK
ncbi:MAG: thioredoxin domain-containing protein [Salinivirgaceae bacterium]|nr:thioredoxin domain-containing protein [Salinivirgaceae bacterium]